MQRWGYNESHYTKKERLSMKSPSVRASALAPYALILLQNVIYGFGDPISKVAYDTVPVFSLLAARYLMAFAFLLLLFTVLLFAEIGIMLKAIKKGPEGIKN